MDLKILILTTFNTVRKLSLRRKLLLSHFILTQTQTLRFLIHHAKTDSGEFGPSLSENEVLIQRQCRESSLIYGRSDPCFGSSIIESNISCCYCYDRYPNFVLVDDEWSSHRIKFGAQPTTKPIFQSNDLLYWFCAEPRNNPLNTNWTKYENMKEKIVVVTGKFGYNDQFSNDVSYFCNDAKETGLFNNSNIHCYSESPSFIIEDARFAKHLKFRTDPNDVSAKGGGYWFHKSVLLRHHMENEEDGKYIIWADNDRFNFFQHGSFQGLMVAVEERNADFAIEELVGCPEKQWSKEDILQAFNVSESVRESNQLNANAVVIRNSPKMRRFVDAWVDCVSNFHMVSDEESVIPNRNDFMDNRHDQSLLGLLMKQFLSNESMIGPPARPYHDIATLHTYQLDEKNFELLNCPFKDSYDSTEPLTTNINEAYGPNVSLNTNVNII
jgi:hypothetical protein